MVAVKAQCVTDLRIGDAGGVGLRQFENGVLEGLQAELCLLRRPQRHNDFDLR